MIKWHAHVAHMTKHMNMVGGPGPGPLGRPLNPALHSMVVLIIGANCSLFSNPLDSISPFGGQLPTKDPQHI